MATARRAYTAEYSYNSIPQQQPERVRRTRQRPQPEIQPQSKPQKRQEGRSAQTVMTPAVLKALIVVTVALGVMLIGIVVVNAQAAKLQYSINQIRDENRTIQTEMDVLTMDIDGSTGIQRLETFATEELQMRYPQENESIVITGGTTHEDSLAAAIMAKAYS